MLQGNAEQATRGHQLHSTASLAKTGSEESHSNATAQPHHHPFILHVKKSTPLKRAGRRALKIRTWAGKPSRPSAELPLPTKHQNRELKRSGCVPPHLPLLKF